MQAESLEVKTEDTTTTYWRIAPGLFKYQTEYDQSKGLRAGKPSSEVTVNGPAWTLVMNGSGSGDAFTMDGERLVHYKCSKVFFIPPFSIIEVKFENLKVKFGGYMSDLPLPSDLPRTPVKFNTEEDLTVKTLADAVRIIRNRQDEIPMDRANAPDALAMQARAYLNENYEDSPSISDIADLLEVSHSQLTKAFKRAYGIAPVKYLNILRVQESVRHMLFGGSSASTSAFQVGFEDLSRFNKNFKKIMETIPSQFKFRVTPRVHG